MTCEFLAYWLGGTTRKELGTLLGYGDRQISTLLKDGSERLGETTFYDPHRKRWVADCKASQLRGPRSSQDVIAVLRGLNAWSGKAGNSALSPVVDTARFRRAVSPDIFRILMGACVRKQVVDVLYRAETREFAVAFSPHTLVTAPHRDHFRGYSVFEDVDKGYYWDLVPSRVLQAQIRPDLVYAGAESDSEWWTETSLDLTLRPDLPPTLRNAIRLEHGLSETDRLKVGPIPVALLRYVRAEYTTRRYAGYADNVWIDAAL